MFHIVFDVSGGALINAAMDLDPALEGEMITLKDDYSVGPISDLFSPAGQAERISWWTTISGEEKQSDGPSDAAILEPILQRMQEEEFDEIWIWMAPNVRDVAGYFWLIAQLKSFVGRVYLISLGNLPFIGEKGNVFYPVSLSEIQPREFVKAKKLARPVTTAEFETDPDEWVRLSAENKNLRLLDGGKKITQKADDYYDQQVLQFLQPQFQKISRITQQFQLKSPQKLNEIVLNWRIRQLAASGIAELQAESARLLTKEPA